MPEELESFVSVVLFASVILVHALYVRPRPSSNYDSNVARQDEATTQTKELSEDHKSPTAASSGIRFRYWSTKTRMVKRGRGRAEHFELGTYESGDNVIIVGLQSHRNPNENGIKLLFFKGPRRIKIGFLLMMNSAEKQGSSALVGLFIDPSERKSGLSAPFLAIWLSLCLEAQIEPTTFIMNKPLLCLVLQNTFGFEEADKGGTKVGIAKGPDGHIAIFPVPTGARNVSTLFSKRVLTREGIVLLRGPPKGEVGRDIVVQCTLQLSGEDDAYEKLKVAVDSAIKGRNGDGAFEHMIHSPCVLKRVLLGEQAR